MPAGGVVPGTFMKLGPFIPPGVNHWKGVPSLNQGVKPPCRWVAMRFIGNCPTVWVVSRSRHDGGVDGQDVFVGQLVGNVEQDRRAPLGHDHPGQVFLVPGGQVVVPVKMGCPFKVGMHLFAKLRYPDIVNVGGQACKRLGGFSGQRNVLPDIVGSARPQARQGGDKLPDFCRALGERVSPADAELQRHAKPNPCYCRAFQELSSGNFHSKPPFPPLS